MAKVYKRSNSPFWQAEFTTPEGERIQKSTRCRDKGAALRLAREWERAAEHESADAAAGIERPTGITLVDLASEFLAAMSREKSPNYYCKMEQHIRARILPYFGPETQAVTVARQQIEGFRRALLAGGAPACITAKQVDPAAPMEIPTLNRYMVTLRRMYDFGVRSGHLQANPVANLPALKEKQRVKFRALDDREVAELLANLTPAHALWVRFILATGLRDAEAGGLLWSDIDQVVRKALIRGKGGKIRRVPLTRGAIELLNEIRGDGAAGLVFGSMRRERPLATAWKKTKLPGRAPTAHDFRHTFASRAIAAGLDLEELRAVMGHDSVVTTQRYLHEYGDRWEKMAQKLDRA